MSSLSTQYVTLQLGEDVFAVPVDQVREILDLRPMAYIPEAPDYFLGLIDVRGQSVPVIDLRIKLGMVKSAPTEQTRILVTSLCVHEKILLLGLMTDKVIEVVSLASDTLEDAPDIGAEWRSHYIRGVSRTDKGFVVIFDLGALFASDTKPLGAIGSANHQAGTVTGPKAPKTPQGHSHAAHHAS
jgi:purine-binding chemotaxis protein CheW